AGDHLAPGLGVPNLRRSPGTYSVGVTGRTPTHQLHRLDSTPGHVARDCSAPVEAPLPLRPSRRRAWSPASTRPAKERNPPCLSPAAADAVGQEQPRKGPIKTFTNK
ncbi:unnamed protein product, partial [Ixodes hexagonus]